MAEAKKTVRKTAATARKPVQKPAKAPVAEPAEKAGETAASGLKLPVVAVDGSKDGFMAVPDDMFGAPLNKQLLSQAVRTYLANQREGSASTKTRGEVEGSTRKIYRQKGTGRARHGAIRAPIFVGGGIVFGPRPHSFRLEFPQAMRRKALYVALSAQQKAGRIKIVSGVKELEPKTKQAAGMLTAVGAATPALVIVASMAEPVVRAARNIERVKTVPAAVLNAYDVITSKTLVFTKEAMQEFVKNSK